MVYRKIARNSVQTFRLVGDCESPDSITVHPFLSEAFGDLPQTLASVENDISFCLSINLCYSLQLELDQHPTNKAVDMPPDHNDSMQVTRMLRSNGGIDGLPVIDKL